MHAPCVTRFGTALLACAVAAFAAAPARADVQLPGGGVVHKVDFERHIMGLFGRMGCNSGSCHGSFQGKNGFRLSLFGYDPEKDYLTLTRDLEGRRVNLADPDASLLLLKATGQVQHGGQKRFDKDSWAYQLLRQWIADGAPWHKGSGDIASIAVNPPEYAFPKPGLTGQLRVEATFGDGSKEDITPLCDFRSNDDATVEVNALGQVKALAARRHGRHRLLPRQRPAGARPRADGDRARLPLPRRAGNGLHRPRSFRQAPPAQHRAVGPGRRQRVPAPRDHRRHRFAADAEGGARLPRRRPAR